MVTSNVYVPKRFEGISLPGLNDPEGVAANSDQLKW
jgi:hypothetical protein